MIFIGLKRIDLSGGYVEKLLSNAPPACSTKIAHAKNLRMQFPLSVKARSEALSLISLLISRHEPAHGQTACPLSVRLYGDRMLRSSHTLLLDRLRTSGVRTRSPACPSNDSA